MNEFLRDQITQDNVLSYSEACISVCENLMELKEQDFKRVIIPSRGAYPFYAGALKAYTFLAESFLERHEFWRHFDKWLLPYTSDWGQANITTDSKKIRKFWSKILADSLREEHSPFTHFYNTTVDIVGQRLTINTSDLKISEAARKRENKNEKFIFIDTAVSGKAICDIIDSFNDFNLKDYFIILIADKNGENLKYDFKPKIEREKQFGRLKQINVNCIYSEDASPLLNSGISSIVFPSLIERAYYEVPEFKNSEFVGAGLWFIDSVSHLRSQYPKLNGVRGALATMNFRGMSKKFGSKDVWFGESILDEVEEMIKLLGDFNLLDGASTKELIYNRLASQAVNLKEEVDVTNSHVIRINLTDNEISHVIRSTRHV
jgi:hypothetical protein